MRTLLPIASLLTISFTGLACFAADTNPPTTPDSPAANAPADQSARSLPSNNAPAAVPAPAATNETSSGRNPGTVPSDTASDNSGINQRDQGNHSLTPPDQATIPSNDSQADLTVLAAVRRSIMGDKDLSVDAHNVKLIVKEGVVTLRGPVASQTEKNAIEGLAAKVDGVKKVDDQLDCTVK